MGTVNTAKVADFRTLKFANLDQMWAEVEAIAAADRAGTLRRIGNWTSGQTFGHLSTWIDFAYDGYPADMQPPWIIKLILKFQKNKFMRGPMPRGVQIPGVAGGTKGTDLISLEDGVTRLRRSVERLKTSPPTQRSPVFGPLTHEEAKNMNLRHAELHLGYLHPR
jgi:hypothetical protein